MEAKHLICSVEVEDLAGVQAFFEAMGAVPLRDFEHDNAPGTWLQIGGGILELLARPHGQPDYPPLSVKLVVDDVAGWHTGMAGRGVEVGEVGAMPWNAEGFVVRAPAGPAFSVTAPRPGIDDAPLAIELDPAGPNVLHFQTTWWSKRWQDDFAFVSKGLGLVTSRGRGEPAGSRIAFLRAAYEGKAIVEIVDGLHDSYDGPGLHWLISLVVDDAEGFHQRLIKAGQPVGRLGYTNWGVPSFTAKADAGPLLFVYQERDGGTPGMVGEPAGLAAMG